VAPAVCGQQCVQIRNDGFVSVEVTAESVATAPPVIEIDR